MRFEILMIAYIIPDDTLGEISGPSPKNVGTRVGYDALWR